MSHGAGSPAEGSQEGLLAQYVRGLTLVGLSGIAFVLAVLQLFLLPDWSAFVDQNALGVHPRAKMIATSVAFGAVLAALCGEWARRYARDSAHGALRAMRLGRLLCPLLALPLIPPLLVRAPWEKSELLFLAALAIVSLALERLLTISFSAWPPSWSRGLLRFWRQFDPKLGSFVALALVLVLSVYYYFYVGQRTALVHDKMLSASSDLAEFDNLFFNALHGHPFRSPAIDTDLRDFGALKVHAEFGLYLLLPFYALSPRAETLLWIQAAVIALCAIPAYLIAARRLGRVTGVVLAVVLLFLPVVQRPNFYDFHFSPLGMLLTLWTLYFLDGLLWLPSGKGAPLPAVLRRRTVLFWGSFLLALSSREDVSLGFVVVGAFVAVAARRVSLGVTILSVALAYFVSMKFGVMPRFGRMWFDTIYQDLKAPEAKGFGAVALTLLSNPAFVLRSLVTEPKFLYFLHMSVPLLFLWLRRPWLWVAAAPGFISTLLVTNRPPMFESSFQYAYLWVPYVFMGSVLSLATLPETALGAARRRAAVLALCLAATASCLQLGVLLGSEKIRGGFIVKTFDMTEQDYQRKEQLGELIDLIPKEASVTASEAIGPHVSNRLVMYSLKYALGHQPDFILVERPRMPAEKVHLLEALDSGKYGAVERRGPFWLLERGAETKRNRAFRRWLGLGRR